MFLQVGTCYQGRVAVVWLSWLVGGVCGVLILLVVICYCRLMPRQQKSFDEQYLKENYTIKENYAYSSQDNYRMKHADVGVSVQRHTRPASYSGDARRPPPAPAPPTHAHHTAAHQYASSSMLDEGEEAGGGGSESACEALKTRSLPACVRGRARPLSAADAERHADHADTADLHPLLAKVSVSKKYKNRMRNEHAAIIALSKSRARLPGPPAPHADAVIVYDQRTQL